MYNDNPVFISFVNINVELLCSAFGIIKDLEISDDCIISAVKNVGNVFQTRRFLSHIVPHIQMHVHSFVQNVVKPFVNRVRCMFTTGPINLKKLKIDIPVISVINGECNYKIFHLDSGRTTVSGKRCFEITYKISKEVFTL